MMRFDNDTSLNGVIQNGEINNPPHKWDPMTGLSKNMFYGRQKP